MPGRSSSALILLLAACLIAAGCGKSNEDRIKETSDAIAAAWERNDFAGACSYATPQLLSTYGGPAGCASALAAAVQRVGFVFRSLHIAKVSVLGMSAVVTIDQPFDFQVLVQQVNGRWLVGGV
jgi:hypothetical protein